MAKRDISDEKKYRLFDDALMQACNEYPCLTKAEEIAKAIVNKEEYIDDLAELRVECTNNNQVLKGDLLVYIFLRVVELENSNTTTELNQLKNELQQLKDGLEANKKQRIQNLASGKRKTKFKKHHYHKMFELRTKNKFTTSKLADIYNSSRWIISNIMNNHMQLKDESDEEFAKRRDTKGEWKW